MSEPLWKHPLYPRWRSMHASAYGETAEKWREVGANVPGICERWVGFSCNDDGFANFISDVGEPPEKRACLRRLDLSKDWSPENVVWSTRGKIFKLNKGGRLLGWQNWFPDEKRKQIEGKLQGNCRRWANIVKI